MNKVIRVGGLWDKPSQKHQAGSIYLIDGISPNLVCNGGGQHIPLIIVKEERKEYMDNLRIRKLTPKECWRLMGFDDEDYEKAKEVNSDTQLYKQAGNSIVVDVLMAIFKEML